MGKKAKFKQLRRIASAMPVIEVGHVIGERVKGVDIIAKGVHIVSGQEVDASANYREKKLIKVPLNHNRKMKKLYYMNGMNGVSAYMQAVKQYAAKHA